MDEFNHQTSSMNQSLSYFPSSSRPEPTTPGEPNHPARILIVDDDHLLCGLHSLILERHGYDTVVAENGQEALDRLSNGHFDLVITDRTMPVLDGASMILALRSAGSQIPVIMISGSFALSPLPPAIASEVSATLLKPAHPSEILDAVAQVLSTHPVAEDSSATLDLLAVGTRF